jgi:polysaccharide export outer membrane protein
MTVRVIAVVVSVLLLAFGSAAAAQGYRVQPGDTVTIEVAQDPSLNRDILVAPDGSISFPPVGQVRAGGRTLEQIAASVAEGLRAGFAGAPTVYASLRALRPPPVILPDRTVTVYVTGEMNAPGALEVAPDATLLQVIASAGGPTRFAAMNRVQLRRIDARTGAETIYQIDAEELLAGRGDAVSLRIREGDVLVVPERRLFE